MSAFNDAEFEQLLRRSLETLQTEPVESGQCGSYMSLALLMDRGNSSFTSAEHVAGCRSCGEMLARYLAHSCPSLRVLKDYRKESRDMARLAPLGWHIVTCSRCRTRLALASIIPGPSRWSGANRGDGGRHLLSRVIPVLSSVAALAFMVVAGWMGFQLKTERNGITIRENAWNSEKRVTGNRIRELERKLQQRDQVLSQQATAQVQAKNGAGTGPVLSLILFPGVLRDADATRGEDKASTVTILEGATRLHLELKTEIPLDKDRYEVAVRAEHGNNLWQGVVLRRTGSPSSAVSAAIPIRFLPPGRYFVTLSQQDKSGESTVIHDYVFRVANASLH